MTRYSPAILTLLVLFVSSCLSANRANAEIYELRTYVTNEGKLDDLHNRFRDHTVKLFQKHGMESVGYWVPTDGPTAENTLIYVLRHESRDAARESWKNFLADPDWRAAYQASEAAGPILAKRPESTYMSETDYSPSFANEDPSDDGVYELRIYRTNEGKLDNLNARFRDHTVRIFARHGIDSVSYWVPTGEPESNDTLIYILRHDSRDAAKLSWKAFGSDPEWKKVASESQKDGRFLRERPESVYLKPTDYSSLQ